MTPTPDSWGRLSYPPSAAVRRYDARRAPLDLDPAVTWLPYGNGRSYGDSCLNPGGGLIDCRGLDKFVDWNPDTGDLTCEAGVTFADILQFAVPRGWFLPVTPGTQFVTLGGAIANDVHGKNHHAGGSVGHHVRWMELLRSDGTRESLTPDDAAGRFRATIGGLGLTGLITQATLRLKRSPGPWILQTVKRFGALDEFFTVDAELKAAHEYTVAWVDCVAPAGKRGRGIYMAGNPTPLDRVEPRGRKLRVPFDPPLSLISPLTLRAFNFAYFHKPVKHGAHVIHYQPFFYPLDGILEWNRIYGPRGMFQFQCVIPPAAARAGMNVILDLIARHSAGSFLAVLKTFGEMPNAGLLSFPRPGTTLALDFPNRGERTRVLMAELEAATLDHGGALYPAKDALMSAQAFRTSYPQWRELLPHLDPRFSSAFWRRVQGD